jgi:Fic family protein
MTTLDLLARQGTQIPAPTLWYVSELMEARGKQALYTKQSPQRLKTLREHALIESAVSSNRIEGVEVDRKRVETVVFGRSALRDRDEEEVRGYRQALDLIHTKGARLEVDEATILRLHSLARGDIWDAGAYKDKDGDTPLRQGYGGQVIETYPDGRSRVRFRTVPAKDTSAAMAHLVEAWRACQRDKTVHPLIALAAFNLDFLCIHPFRDGNGRVSRLLLLLQLYHTGFEVGRYVSIEKLIEQTKKRYYETLEQSSQGWHEATHDPWPAINYLLSTLRSATRELERRVEGAPSPKGEKAALVRDAVSKQEGEFRVRDIERDCPGVGLDWIRTVLGTMKEAGEVERLTMGRDARWRRGVK